MAAEGTYLDYTQQMLEDYATFSSERHFMLTDAISGAKIERVLDVGCGAGQELLPFAERTTAFCVGIDIAPEVGHVGKATFERFGLERRAEFLQSRGEYLPFASESFDVVICRVALPYMDNRLAIKEISRVLKTNGKLFLKIHAPMFYFGMLKRRLPTLNPKQLAYPVICLAGGAWNLLSGRHPKGEFWKGKEVFQTRQFLKKELSRSNLKIKSTLPDSNRELPSFLIVKN